MSYHLKEGHLGQEGKGGRVKVVDRRWFDAEGEPREGVSIPEPLPPPPPATPAATEAPAAPPTDEPVAVSQTPVKLPAGVLLELVDVLTQYAMAFLTGQVPGVNRDTAAARLFIDLLSEVQKRTEGNLSPQETKVLDDVLFQLRALYISPR